MSRWGIVIEKSLWADDVFIFGSSTEQQLHVLRCLDKGLLLSRDHAVRLQAPYARPRMPIPPGIQSALIRLCYSCQHILPVIYAS